MHFGRKCGASVSSGWPFMTAAERDGTKQATAITNTQNRHFRDIRMRLRIIASTRSSRALEVYDVDVHTVPGVFFDDNHARTDFRMNHRPIV